jgi:protein-S-isoprenylcysteine O-methyltransferase Ste14
MSRTSGIDTHRLAIKSIRRFLSGLIFLAGILFLSAGTLHYWNGWLFLAAVFIPMFFALMYLLTHDPGLLEKRMKTKETQEQQKFVQKAGAVFVLSGFLLPGFDHRFTWSHIPLWLVLTAAVFLVAAYVLTIVVMMQNSYASRVIEVQEHQKVIDHGLYSVMRHPMYLFSSILFLCTPIVLGSWYGLLPMAMYPVIMIVRLKNEEEILKKELGGYEEYMNKVKYRLVPFLW